jgi:hypothetical protein
MPTNIDVVLESVRINRAIERIRSAPTPLSDIFGWSNGTGNVDPIGGRHFRYDYFERTKDLAAGRAPGSPPARVAPRPVGSVQGAFPRHHEKIPLDDERIHNFRRTGGPQGELDTRGENYIAQQLQHIGDKFRNVIEFQTAAMLKGSYTYTPDGDDSDPAYTGGAQTVNFNIPAGNLNQISGSISASWATATTDIPLDCMKVNERAQEVSGRPITDAICNVDQWNNIVNNNVVSAGGGTSFKPFDSLNQDRDNGNFQGIIRAIPWLTWHIVSTKLEISGSNVSSIGAEQVVFLPRISRDWVTLGLGSEVVTEGPNGVREERMGQYFWSYPDYEPSGWNILGVYNGIPNLYAPNAIFNADVIF